MMAHLTRALLVTAALFCAQASVAAELPPKGPLPDPKPVTDEAKTPENAATPLPVEKPAQDKPDATPADATSGATPEKKSGEQTKQAAPDRPGETAPEAEKNTEPDKSEDAESSAAIIPPTPADDAACRAELQALGTRFATAKPIDDGEGCGIAAPITVTEILPGITLAPEGVMGCHAARALARWTKETVIPTASLAGETATVTSIEQASAYVCKRRNGAATGKMSEHAHGNAVDIAAIVFSDGKRLEMKPREEDGTMEGALQRSLTAAACLHFSTVLSPGSDATHETHLHLDTLERQGGFRYCR
ncbi:Uncharacterized conserved protein [Rhizobium sp. RU20A]|nr:Uncharacterized conserved protein [Rhizobium sp. RU20A]